MDLLVDAELCELMHLRKISYIFSKQPYFLNNHLNEKLINI